MNRLLPIRISSLHVGQEHVQILQTFHQLIFRLHLFLYHMRCLIDSRLHLMKLRLLRTSWTWHWTLVWNHSADKLLRVLDPSVDFVLSNDLGMFGQIFQVHRFYLSLKLFFFFVDLVHVFPHELLNVQVFVTCAPRGFVSGLRKPRAWLPSP